VGNALAMAVSKSYENLLEDAACLFFIKLLVDHLLKVGMQAATIYILHYQVDMSVSFECFDELDDVLMVHLLK
jgi:hypothetical protein